MAISTWDEHLGLSMVEAFVPTARRAFADNPVSAFRDLDDIVGHVLRISDPLGVYVGKFAPKARHRSLAKAICAKLNPKLLAVQLSAVHKRDFQNATFFLAFLRKTHRSKFDATVSALDWSAIERTIGDDWQSLPHEAEIFLTVCYSNTHARETVREIVFHNLNRIVQFSARVACFAPKAACAHLDAGKLIRLAYHGHCEWKFGAILIAELSKERPDLIDTMIAPLQGEIGTTLSGQNSSWFKEAALFIELLIEKSPENLQGILGTIDTTKAEAGWADCLEHGGEPRRTAAFLVEAAISRADGVGEMARRVRKRFPKVSIPVPSK
jgi:hypothetical protein